MNDTFKTAGKQAAVVLLIILVAAGVWYVWLRDAHKAGVPQGAGAEKILTEPFANVVIPGNIDADTTALFVAHVSSTKALYEGNPEDPRAWIAIGNLYHLFKQPEEAIVAYKQAIHLQPDNLVAYRNIAETYVRDLGDAAQGATYYRLAITRDMADPTLYISLGMLLESNLHQSEAAEKVYLDGLPKTHYDRDVLLNLVELYKRMGNTEKYKEYGTLLLSRFPKDELIQQKYKALLNQP